MTDPLTDAYLDAIGQRANAATEGPWEERWKAIPGHDGYEVSDFGNVRSYFVKGNYRSIGKRSPYPRLLKLVDANVDGAHYAIRIYEALDGGE